MNDKAEMTRMLTDYYLAFSSLDMHRILPFFHEPSALLSPAGVAALSTRADLAAALAPLLEGLRERGYARSELTRLHLKRLSLTTTLGSGVAVRYKADGQELERAGVTYLLHKTSSGWKIAALVTHDADNDLQGAPKP
jgi:hypothetical protein